MPKGEATRKALGSLVLIVELDSALGTEVAFLVVQTGSGHDDTFFFRARAQKQGVLANTVQALALASNIHLSRRDQRVYYDNFWLCVSLQHRIICTTQLVCPA